MVLASMRDELWRGQAQGWQSHTQTDTHIDTQTYAGNDNTRRPKLAYGKKIGNKKLRNFTERYTSVTDLINNRLYMA